MMGLFKKSCYNSNDTPLCNRDYLDNINPDPKRFKILKCIESKVNNYCLVEVKYLNCTNYEGHKLLLIRDTSTSMLSRVDELDPHFSINNNIVARFKPDREGWFLAMLLLNNSESFDKIEAVRKAHLDRETYNSVREYINAKGIDIDLRKYK